MVNAEADPSFVGLIHIFGILFKKEEFKIISAALV